MQLHRIGSGGLLPDRTLLLEMPVFDASGRQFERDGDRVDRFGRKEGSYHDEVADSFRALAGNDPERLRVIDAQGSVEDVGARILQALDDLL